MKSERVRMWLSLVDVMLEDVKWTIVDVYAKWRSRIEVHIVDGSVHDEGILICKPSFIYG